MTEITAPPKGRRTKRPGLTIRQMEMDDLPQVFHLGERLFTPQEYPNLYRTWDEFEVVGLFLSDTETCLVCEADNLMAGFLLGTTIEKPRSAWKYGYLIWLGVEPEYQGQGVADKLFHHFLEIMEECGARILLVDTQADNEAALRFFRKMGFRSPEKHVFLSMNLGKQHAKTENGKHHIPKGGRKGQK